MPKERTGSALSLKLFISLLAAALVPLAGCCHAPTLNTNVTGNAHMLTEAPTPGNSGPVQPFTVPAADAGCCGPAVAVIDVDGLLMNYDFVGPGSAGENPVSIFRERLDAAAADPCVRAVVIKINTPGGGVTASDIMRHDLEQFKQRTHLPVIACLMDVGAGGGYYLATAADQIVAHPTTLTGGIGVILNLYNLSGVMESKEIGYIPIKSGNGINAGVQLRRAPQMPGMDDEVPPLADQILEQRKMLQNIANQYHARFKDAVIASRPMLVMGEEDIFSARVFIGTRALQLHMVDTLGYLDDAVDIARNAGGVPGARVVIYHRCNDRARTIYSVTPNVPIQGQVMAMNLPGLDRASMPTFMYLWQPEPTMEKKLTGR
jgi:protease-4